MKRILVTSKDTVKGFVGAVQLVYGLPSLGHRRPLEAVDFREANLTQEQKEWFMSHIPRGYGTGFAQEWGVTKLNIIETELEYDFDTDFWIPFDNKVNRERCLKCWNNLSKADRAACVQGLGGYFRHLSRNQWKTKMNPHTWLTNKHWQTNWDNLNV